MGNESVEDRFARRVRAERESRGWTQAQLAEALSEHGIKFHQSAIAKIENRDVDRPRVIRLDEAEALARVFGLSLNEMFESFDYRRIALARRFLAWLDKLGETRHEGRRFIDEIEALARDAGSDDEAWNIQEDFRLEELKDTLGAINFSSYASKVRHPSRLGGYSWSKLGNESFDDE
ncbi:helix-turn-helix transcriptional regulator [Prescottella agglutinans]|uniref:Transcriptional regulator with XRE-family HTH domain n=1 Tax=Prescottella agglutinans TaxID=1644129 RepID=A0ABT6MH18_9NOCA|nr:helix-turn-helix transcriptional regulator [Prescottella agglutinans]MDH6283540.1 transcriptional regulator with XRE-family HTH domain [Prescottella agglutinans]